MNKNQRQWVSFQPDWNLLQLYVFIKENCVSAPGSDGDAENWRVRIM